MQVTTPPERERQLCKDKQYRGLSLFVKHSDVGVNSFLFKQYAIVAGSTSFEFTNAAGINRVKPTYVLSLLCPESSRNVMHPVEGLAGSTNDEHYDTATAPQVRSIRGKEVRNSIYVGYPREIGSGRGTPDPMVGSTVIGRRSRDEMAQAKSFK